MFQQARIKLTVWYLAIIMAISLFFSILIYRGVTHELSGRLRMIERRLELPRYGMRPPVGQTEFFFLDYMEVRKRIILILAYTNVAILMVSAVAGYFLAGQTLAPIVSAMEEQKRFVADASHELKTPLTALYTSIEVALRDKKLTLPAAYRALQENLTDVQNLTKLSDELLSLARYQDGQNNLKREDVDVKDALDAARTRVAPLAKRKGVALSITTAPHVITAHRESLVKLFAILFDNALKYTDTGGSVTVDTVRERKQLVVNVRDTGIGIAKKDLPFLFERFYRIDQSRAKKPAQGFGLGLSIAKKIVTLHGGSIDVRSAPGKGSTFSVRMPVA